MCLIKYEILLVKGNYHGTFFFTVTVHRFDLRNVSSPLYHTYTNRQNIFYLYDLCLQNNNSCIKIEKA